MRAAAVTVFGTGLALSAARVVGTRLEPILFVPVMVAAIVGWLSSRLAIVLRLIAQLVAFVGTGLLVAYVSDGGIADLGRGLLRGPRQLVTTSWPSPRFTTIFVALAALVFVAVAVSMELAMRTRWRALAIVPLVLAMIAIIAVSAPDGPQWPPLVCAVVGAFLLLWIGFDDRVASVRSGSWVAVLVGVAALTATLAVAISHRADPRHNDDPDRELFLLDPLSEVAAQRNAQQSTPIYRVESSSLDRLHRWRTAALDVYNGESWSADGRLTPVGNRVAAGTGADQIAVKITALRDDTVVWATPGNLLRTTDPVETDSHRRVVRIIGDERPAVNGFTVEAPTGFDPATSGDVASVRPTDIEGSYAQRANQLAGGSGTLAEQVARLAHALHDEYTLDSSDPGGVQQNLIDHFLRDTKVGNKEQFITGFVLLARSLGVDARIATGYLIDAVSTSAEITTADAAAWAEVHVANGWAEVDVLPEDSTVTTPAPDPAGRALTPPAVQPLSPPDVEQPNLDDTADAPLPTAKSNVWARVRVWVARGGLIACVLLTPVALFAAFVTWKKRHRRKGLKASDPAQRVSTAWVLATDALVDAGATLQRSQTNAELAEAGVVAQPEAGPPLGRLQRHADAVVFTTGSCDPARATDAVAQLRLIEASILSSLSRWWRWKWRLSTRSLRRRTQSPLR